VTSCRVCGGTETVFLDLGRQPLSDAFPDPREQAPEFFYDLRVASCDECGTVQLADEVPRERMFGEEYPFRTSSSARMTAHFRAMADRLVTLAGHEDPFIIEIGCNDGTLLAALAERGIRHLGVDPAANLVKEANARGVDAIAAYFEAQTARDVHAQHGPADVVYAANTLCHVPYLDEIFAGLDALLGPDGVFVFEDPYLGDIVELGSFDQIYDEHFWFFSATSVARIAERLGFELVDVEHLPVHGGEVRYTVARTGRRPVSDAVAEMRAEEERRRLHDPEVLRAFAATVAERRTQLVDALTTLKAEGRTVAGYAATAKSATVLNYCGIGPSLLPVVYDTTPEKQGRLTPGSGIPVQPFPADPSGYPDCFLLFAWNHTEEILAKEQAFAERGGRWIRYVPRVTVG
jgi:methylation protein EvaC